MGKFELKVFFKLFLYHLCLVDPLGRNEDFEEYEKKYLERVTKNETLDRTTKNEHLLGSNDEDEWDNEDAKNYAHDGNAGSINRIFSDYFGKHVDIGSGLESIISHRPYTKRKIKVRYFFSRDGGSKVYSKDFTEMNRENLMHLVIEPTRNPKNTTWVYGGNYEIGDNFEPGYTLNITFQQDDSELRKFLINKLRELNFGSIPSRKTIISHKNSDHPNNIDARKLLREILESFQS